MDQKAIPFLVYQTIVWTTWSMLLHVKTQMMRVGTANLMCYKANVLIASGSVVLIKIVEMA